MTYKLLFLVFSLSWTPKGVSQIDDLYAKTNQFEKDVRYQKYNLQTGRARLKSLLTQVKDDYKKRECSPLRAKRWVFPVAWHGNRDIGGNHGNGYKPQGFRYFDGIKTKGHSAHDIFIHDRDNDLKDDRYKKPVPALAVEPGVVLSIEDNWDSNSKLKAGLYINIYHPHNNKVSYYSHLQKIHVRPGDCVNAGDPIAWIGRTGLNADARRSPTHLHFGRLFFDGQTYRASDPYQQLIRSEKINFKP